MATPNQMPKRPNKISQEIVGALINTAPTSWKRKVWNEEKNTVDTVTVSQQTLKFPLAANVSDDNVERIASRLIK